jgi:hypothetical protein
VSDRGPILISKYWKAFCHYLSTTTKLSTAFHPQTDGQTERQNRTLEQYLRIYCCFEQDDWAFWLSTAEFAYNDSVHASTGITPFQAYTGRHPRGGNWPETGPKADVLDAREITTRILELQKYLKAKLGQVQVYQAEFFNRRHKDVKLVVGDLVMLSTANIRSIRPKKKLDKKFEGPHRITEVINPVAYRIELPKGVFIHDVFHVSLLEKYAPSKQFPTQYIPTWNTLDPGDEDVYEVEKILGEKRNAEGLMEYHIKWKGYPESDNTWEVASNISRAAMTAYNHGKRKRR